MRSSILLIVVMLIAACTPPHPTHPTKVDCPVQVETRFSARVTTSPLGTGAQPGGGSTLRPDNDPAIQPSTDPCNEPSGGASYSEWTQTSTTSVPICVRAGTTPEQATSVCFTHLAPRIGEAGGSPPAPHPPFGRICGSLTVISSRITGSGGNPALHPEQCREGTSWPLL